MHIKFARKMTANCQLYKYLLNSDLHRRNLYFLFNFLL